MDALSNCGDQQCRSHWVVIYSEGNKDGHIDYKEYKTHLQDTEKARAVTPRAIKKGTGRLKDIFTNVSSVEHNRIFSPYVAGTQV